MEKLGHGTLLYHGSYTEIKDINLSECIAGKDFGKGFYLTSSFEQAKNFLKLSVKRNSTLGKIDKNQNYGYVSIYELTSTENISDYYFESANLEWLHFVAGNRDDSLFQEEILHLQGYNVIVGKIANDRTATTLQAYIDGINGDPGDLLVDKNTIEVLLPNRLENQYCFRNEDAIKSLRFIRSEKVMIDG